MAIVLGIIIWIILRIITLRIILRILILFLGITLRIKRTFWIVEWKFWIIVHILDLLWISQLSQHRIFFVGQLGL